MDINNNFKVPTDEFSMRELMNTDPFFVDHSNNRLVKRIAKAAANYFSHAENATEHEVRLGVAMVITNMEGQGENFRREQSHLEALLLGKEHSDNAEVTYEGCCIIS